MSKNRKNFHYHYAEKFEKTSRERKRHLFVSPIALVISLVLLVVFGLVSATFSVYVTDNLNDPDSVSDGSMLIKVRDHKKRIDAGLDAPLHRSDLPVVQTGAVLDTAESAVNVDKVETGTTPTAYAIAGIGDWTRRYMTVSDGGYYCYYEVDETHSSGEKISFAILPDTNTWDRVVTVSNFSTRYAGDNFWNSGAIYNDNSLGWSWADNPGDGDRVYFEYKNSKKVYIVMYFPNTELNTFDYPKITYYNTLPDDTAGYYITNNFGNGSTYVNTKIGDSSSGPGATYSFTATLPTANHTYHYRFYKDFSVTSYQNKGNDTYSNNGTMTSSNCTGWNFKTNENTSGYAGITSADAANGDYSFSVVDSSWHDDSNYEKVNVSVTYPTVYTVSRASAPSNGSLYIGTSSDPSGTSTLNLFSGNTYYVKAIPDANYQIKTLTIGGSAVSLTDAEKVSGVTLSRTMGSSNVTVSVTYEERLIPHWADNAFSNMTKSVTDTTTFYASGTIMYPSSASGTLTVEASVTSGNSVETNGNPTISGSGGTTGTAIIPLRITNKTGNSTITAVLKDGNTTMGSTTFTVTVSEPTVLFDNLSIEECRSGTLTVSSSTPALQNGWTYSWSTTSSDITLDSGASITSQPITAKPYTAASHDVKLTVTYPSGYQKTYTKAITVTESTIKIKSSYDVNEHDWTEHKMLYDATASTYGHGDLYSFAYPVALSPNTEYEFGMLEGSTFYKGGGDIYDTTGCLVTYASDQGKLLSSADSGSNCKLHTGNEGIYTFYYNPTNHRLFLSLFPGDEFYLVGLGSGDSDWARTPARKMTETSPGVYTWTKTMSYDQTFTQGQNTGFKIYHNNGTYYGLQNTTFTHTDSVQLTDDDEGDTYNLGLSGSYSGTYTFTFNSSTLALTVTYPSRTVKSQAYFNGSAVGTEASIGSSSDFVTITYIGQDKFRLTANTASDFAYTFEKWRNDNTTTIQREITVTNSNPVQIDSDWTYSSFDIYLHTVISGVTATGFTQDSVDNTKLIGSYTYPNSVTLPTPTGPSGYTFAGWYDNSSCTGNALTAPEIAAGSTDVKEFWAKWTIAITINDNIDGNTLYTYNIPYNGSISPSKNDWNSADVALVNRGYTLSGFNDNSWTNLTTSKTIIAIYVPNVYDFDVTFTPNQNVEDKNGNAGSSMAQGTGDSAASPYVLTFGSDIAVSASFTAPANLDSNITYNWFIMNGSSRVPVPSTKTSSAGAVTVTYENDHVSSMMTQMAQNGNGVEFTLYVEATVTTASGTFTNSLNKSDTIYYKVKSPIDALSVVPDQLIYSSAPDLSVIITTHSSITNDNVTKLMSSFKSVLQYYDKDTDQFTDLVGNVAIAGQKPVFSSTVAANTYREEDASAASGVNYFKFKLQELISGQPARDDSETSERTVTVGAFDAQTSRPLFVKSDVDLTGYRVMLFYVNSNNQLNYQTSEYSSTNSWYRFEIPSNDSGNTPISVCIAAFDKDEKYVLPKYNNGTYTWSDGTTGFNTHVFGHGHVDVSSDTQYVTIKSLSGTTFTIE